MYYESRVHEILPPVQSYAELCAIITASPSYQVATIVNSKGKTIGFVPDGHIDNPRLELAVVNITDGLQIESLTWGWIEPLEREEALKDVAESDYNMGATVIPTSAQDETPAKFTCGCCGVYFGSTIKKQVKFDQDSGYGICKSCEKYYS